MGCLHRMMEMVDARFRRFRRYALCCRDDVRQLGDPTTGGHNLEFSKRAFLFASLALCCFLLILAEFMRLIMIHPEVPFAVTM